MYAKGLYKTFTYPMSMNRNRMNITQCTHVNLNGNSLIYSLSLLVKRFKEENQLFSNCVNISSKTPSKTLISMNLSSVQRTNLYDRIFGSVHLGVLNV